MNALKIVIVGGGSVAWTPKLVRDMLLTASLADAHFVLLDRDRAAADLTRAFLEKLARQLGSSARFTATDRREEMEGARYVIITISTGGFDSMSHDLAIPEKYGIYHTVGDTSGPGGWARLIRNFDVFVTLAEDINRWAPNAVVLNYTNPMTTLTDVLCRICTGPVVGLCHGLFENIRLLQKLYDAGDESQISLRYAGINHFFWITQARVRQIDVMSDLRDRFAAGATFTSLLNEGYVDSMGMKSNREVASELFRLTDVMPYLGDRHTCEFFNCYITDPARMASYRLTRTTIAERRDQHGRFRRELLQMTKDEISSEYLTRSRETAADIIDAHSQGTTFIDVGNVPNVGQIDNLPRGLVVETAVRVDASGITPVSFGSLPPVVQGLIEPHAHMYRLVVDACFQGNRRLANQVLRLDPVCSHLSGKQVVEMGDELISAHRNYVSRF